MKILMAISGGVDSSAAALKLKQEGHELVGVMMKIYTGDSKCDAQNSCYGISKEKEIEDARAVCEKLGIDFHLIDCSFEFQKRVFSRFKSEYAAGRTPNPCVLCNPEVKFGVLPDLARALGIEFDKFATGHYARIKYNEETGRYNLLRGLEAKKDQSYFLYGLSQKQLARTIFPLGDWLKEQTREFAQQNGLITFDKSDSQDFYKGDYNDILDIPPKEGDIILRDGTVLGKHYGIHNFTVGQRKGIKIAYKEPLYVLELDSENNKVIVGSKDETFSYTLLAKCVNWIVSEKMPQKLLCKAKHRSTQEPQKCYIEACDIDKIKVTFQNEQSSVTIGQSVVFYDDDAVLGGAIIDKVLYGEDFTNIGEKTWSKEQ